MKKFKLYLCGILIICTNTFPILGQTGIRGKVVGKTTYDEQLHAKVYLFKDGALYASTRSDSNGQFEFQNLEPGKYDLEGLISGSNTHRLLNVNVDEDVTSLINIKADSLETSGDEICMAYYNQPAKLVSNY